MNRLEQLREELAAIERDIEISKQLRPSKEVGELRRRLFGRLSFVKQQISKLVMSKEEKQRERHARVEKANENRSTKNKRSWRFVKSVQQNYFPDKSSQEVRSLYKKFRQGLDKGGSDVVWRNPSP